MYTPIRSSFPLCGRVPNIMFFPLVSPLLRENLFDAIIQRALTRRLATASRIYISPILGIYLGHCILSTGCRTTRRGSSSVNEGAGSGLLGKGRSAEANLVRFPSGHRDCYIVPLFSSLPHIPERTPVARLHGAHALVFFDAGMSAHYECSVLCVNMRQCGLHRPCCLHAWGL